MRKARHMLDVLLEQMDKFFNCGVTGDELWFACLYLSDHILVSGREDAVPSEKQIIGAGKVMTTILFSGTNLISLEVLSHDQTYTQEYFIENVLRDLGNKNM
jgi:hypothetical protein